MNRYGAKAVARKRVFEIEHLFDMFDKDRSGGLDRHACAGGLNTVCKK